MHIRHQHLFKTNLQSWRPTRITVDHAEDGRKKFLDGHRFPAVRGPKDLFCIADHHPLGRALLLLEGGVKQCYVVPLKHLALYRAPQAAHPSGWSLEESAGPALRT